ncbi:hypothetical protein [Sporolactobacillus terrae]|uniref:hypothetical protein n=1 Tax=Sporolactobacillus terrae TaxID=269673 RepID=UPI00111ADBE5|nr:hypothetical protein [Sporolactobacillus terrae]
MESILEKVEDYTIGKGRYNSTHDEKAYTTWNNMIRRCYFESDYKSWQRYKNCTVAEEWHNFQNFAEWYYENYYMVPGCRMELDKDLLIKGNKRYASDRCCFLPSELNNILTYNKSNKGNLPVGVSRYKDKFKAQLSEVGYLGMFDDPVSAFEVYKEAKEKKIKETAEKYREWIPNKAFEKLLNWQVEIDD